MQMKKKEEEEKKIKAPEPKWAEKKCREAEYPEKRMEIVIIQKKKS